MGLMVFFYKSCWKIIKDGLLRAISEFFAGGELPKSWTSANLLPVPKIENPTSFNHLRPISLCNFCNKIISKLLMLRLAHILPLIISRKQAGFVQGRLINDNIVLAQELIQSIKKKVRGSNLVIKLDVSKAYDSISWLALIRIMRKFGFNEMWIDMIYRLISNCWYSVLVNGVSTGYFTSNR